MKVRADGLACFKGGRLVFENVSFDADEGDCIEITGPNGSGKSTLLRILAGLELPYAGISVVPGDGLAYLGHSDGLKADLTVTDNVRYWSGIHGSKCNDHLINRFELAHLMNLSLRQLSSGQRKRVALVSAMSSGARVWLLDEPVTSLDPVWVERTFDSVSEQCSAGGVVVLTTLCKSLNQAKTVRLGSTIEAISAGMRH